MLKGVINGICFGFTFFAAYATHALAYWYGTQLFIDGDYSAGQIYVVSPQCLHVIQGVFVLVEIIFCRSTVPGWYVLFVF